MITNQELNEIEARIKELGFSDMFEFVFYHWDKFPEESKQRLESVGVCPKKKVNLK